MYQLTREVFGTRA